MTFTRLLALLLVASSAALTACTGPLPGPAMGTITLDLVGTAPSGRSYRLRDATITVQGPGSVKVWNTEDAPDQTSLSADVVIGDYTALLADGWRLERIDGASAMPVAAELLSDNPARFTVFEHERIGVPLRFRVQDDDVDMNQGYDITVEVEEPGPPVMVVSNAGNTGGFPGIDHGLPGQRRWRSGTAADDRRAETTIDALPADGNGPVAPLRSRPIRGPFQLVAFRNELYVANWSTGIVQVFSADAVDGVPTREIRGPSTQLASPLAVFVH